MKNLFISFFVVIVALTLSLFAGEYALRYIYKDRTTTAGPSYLGRQWSESIQHERNSLGYREKEFDKQAESRVMRIAIVGDSMTYGQGIELESRYSNLLEKQLNRQGMKFEFLNLGRSGNETEDHIEVIKTIVGAIAPDYLLLQWYVNDVEGHDKSYRPSPYLIPSSRIRNYLQKRSILYFLINRQWARWTQTISYEDYLINTFKDPESPASIRAQSALENLIEESEKLQIPMGMVAFPYPVADQLTENASLYFLIKRLMDTCLAHDLTCIELTPAFSTLTNVEELWVNEFDPHPSSLANQIVATEILKHFEPVWKEIRASHNNP